MPYLILIIVTPLRHYLILGYYLILELLLCNYLIVYAIILFWKYCCYYLIIVMQVLLCYYLILEILINEVIN